MDLCNLSEANSQATTKDSGGMPRSLTRFSSLSSTNFLNFYRGETADYVVDIGVF